MAATGSEFRELEFWPLPVSILLLGNHRVLPQQASSATPAKKNQVTPCSIQYFIQTKYRSATQPDLNNNKKEVSQSVIICDPQKHEYLLLLYGMLSQISGGT